MAQGPVTFAGGAYGALDQIMAQRMAEAEFAEQLRARQAAEAFQQQQLAETVRGNQVQEAATQEQQQFRQQQQQGLEQDRRTGRADVLADEIPSGSLLTRNDPTVQTLQQGGRGYLLSSVPELGMPSEFQGPMPTGETPQEAIQGPLEKLPTQGQRLAGAAAEDRDLAREDRVLARQEAADLRRELQQNALTAAAGNRNRVSPGQQFSMVNRLQRDYDKVVTPVREMKRQLTLMESGLEQARKGNLNAGSQQILVTFQKILDPTSVVRESEYARSPQGQAFIKRIEGFGQRVSQGGPGVTIPELEGFVSAAREMTKSMSGHGKEKRAQLSRTAVAFELDPALIFEDDPDGSLPEAIVGGAKPTAADLIKKYGRP